MVTENEIHVGRYLGDGVYISFDGFQFWLAANDHRNRVIALDSDVLVQMQDYINEVRAHYEARARGED